MTPYVWKEEMSPKEAQDGAYWERNMLALHFATYANEAYKEFANYLKMVGSKAETKSTPVCGWYVHGEWEGWSRVISLFDGQMTFHIPDDFDLGNLPQVEPNWDGHGTMDKWLRSMKKCGCELPDLEK